MEETDETVTGWSLFVQVVFDVLKIGLAVFWLYEGIHHHSPDAWFCLLLLILVGAI